MAKPQNQGPVGEVPLERAIALVQEAITNVSDPAQSQAWDEAIAAAQAARPGARETIVRMVMGLLRERGASVEGMSLEEAAEAIFRRLWGLDVLQDAYDDPTVDEIRVNSPTHVFVQRKGKNERLDVRFQDDEHVLNVIQRLLIHDRVSVSRQNPRVESMLQDGTRVTATIPPFSQRPTLVLRKHNTFLPTRENLIAAGTVNDRVMDLLEVAVRGRANILISGGTGTGKTSLLRGLVGYLDPRLRIVTLETDRELLLSQFYPDRDIVELEEHRELDPPITMKSAFRTILRYTPDVILVGEARGAGEAVEMLQACLRGHDASMGTIHTDSPEGAVEGLAEMILEEGKNLPIEIVRRQIARAFDLIVQMYADTARTGIKKVERITELWVEDGQVRFQDLCIWVPSGDDYTVGDWEFPALPSERLIRKLTKHGAPVHRLLGVRV